MNNIHSIHEKHIISLTSIWSSNFRPHPTPTPSFLAILRSRLPSGRVLVLTPASPRPNTRLHLPLKLQARCRLVLALRPPSGSLVRFARRRSQCSCDAKLTQAGRGISYAQGSAGHPSLVAQSMQLATKMNFRIIATAGCGRTSTSW